MITQHGLHAIRLNFSNSRVRIKKERVAELEEIKSGRCCILQMMDCVTGSELRMVHAMHPCVFRHESAEIKDEITTTDPKLNQVNCTQTGNFGHWCWEG